MWIWVLTTRFKYLILGELLACMPGFGPMLEKIASLEC